MRTVIAHALSIAGHPALVMPLAAGLSAALGGASPSLTRPVLLAAGGVAAAVMVYSVVQDRRGKWADGDASAPEERSQLNLFLAPLLAGAAVWAGWSGQPEALAAGLGLAAAVVAMGLAASRWLKLSRHSAFAVFAASLFWPELRLLFLGLGLAVLIAWSRPHLSRHTVGDIVAGGLASAAAGGGFQILLAGPWSRRNPGRVCDHDGEADMKALPVVVLASGLGACADDPFKLKTLNDMHQFNDWQHERGEKLYAALANDFSRLAHAEGRGGNARAAGRGRIRMPVWRGAHGLSGTDGGVRAQNCDAGLPDGLGNVIHERSEMAGQRGLHGRGLPARLRRHRGRFSRASRVRHR